MSEDKKWFESWFDTRYYHLLYRNRDEREAVDFLDKLFGHVALSKGAEVLDLACGKGRHAVYMAKKGLNVTGYDLSPSNISEADRLAHAHLHFYIRDMRDDLGKEKFDAVFNLFTGFGYFESDEENFSVFKRIYEALKPGGLFIFDYLNAECSHLFTEQNLRQNIEGIEFITSKIRRGKKVIKEIEVTDVGKKFHFREEVTLYKAPEIEAALIRLGFQDLQKFGDYTLGVYTAQSPRLVIICRKGN
jgi:cyclopropane fatty-acyl-phospholipid synthase-like methyltransferase